MGGIFEVIFYKPIFSALVALYNVIPGNDIGIAIILLTVVIKAILYPLMSASIKAQKSLQDLQPKVEALKIRYGKDKQALAAETMKLYRENHINPLSSCLPLLVQLPILLALYWVLRDGLGTTDFSRLYSFIQPPERLDATSFGFIDLGAPFAVLAVLAGAAQFWQAKMLSIKRPPKAAATGGKDEDMAAIMNKQMLYVMPVVTVLIGLKLPGGLTLYWFVSTLLTALQQLLIFKRAGRPGAAR